MWLTYNCNILLVLLFFTSGNAHVKSKIFNPQEGEPLACVLRKEQKATHQYDLRTHISLRRITYQWQSPLFPFSRSFSFLQQSSQLSALDSARTLSCIHTRRERARSSRLFRTHHKRQCMQQGLVSPPRKRIPQM